MPNKLRGLLCCMVAVLVFPGANCGKTDGWEKLKGGFPKGEFPATAPEGCIMKGANTYHNQLAGDRYYFRCYGSPNKDYTVTANIRADFGRPMGAEPAANDHWGIVVAMVTETGDTEANQRARGKSELELDVTMKQDGTVDGVIVLVACNKPGAKYSCYFEPSLSFEED